MFTLVSFLSAGLGFGLALAEPPEATALDAAPAPEGPEVYTFGPGSGQLAAFVFESAATENSGRSHHHVVVATRWSGRLQWANGEDCRGQFKVSVAGLLADDPEVRKSEEVGEPLSALDQKRVNEHMRARDQLFADRFPTIQYDVKGCKPGRNGGHVLLGDFSLRGVTREVAFLVNVEEEGATLHLVGEGSITHTAFGMEPYYALFGQRQNQDRLNIRMDVRGEAVGAGSSLGAPIIGAGD